MSVGVMEDYKLRDLRASHTLGWKFVRMSGCDEKLFYYIMKNSGKTESQH